MYVAGTPRKLSELHKEMISVLLAITVLNIIVGNMAVLARDTNEDEEHGIVSKVSGVLGLSAVGGIATKFGAAASVPTIMTATGKVVAGVGTLHGPLVGMVQVVGTASVGTVVGTGAVVVLAGYGICQMTSYGDACDAVVGTVGDGIATGTSAVGNGMWAVVDALRSR